MLPIGFGRVTIKINSVQGQNRSVFLELLALALAVRSHFFWRLCNKEWLTIDIKVCRKLLISCLHHRILHYVEIEDWQLVQSTTPCCCCLLLPMWIGLDCTNLWKIFDHWVKRWINSNDEFDRQLVADFFPQISCMNYNYEFDIIEMFLLLNCFLMIRSVEMNILTPHCDNYVSH